MTLAAGQSSIHGFIYIFRFYRATLCVSAVFAVARCPSVCLSVTFLYSIQTAEDIVKRLRRPGSPIILVYDPSTNTKFQANPFSGGAKYTGVGKMLQFSTEIAVYLGNGTR